MVSAKESGLRGRLSWPCWGQCVVLLGTTETSLKNNNPAELMFAFVLKLPDFISGCKLVEGRSINQNKKFLHAVSHSKKKQKQNRPLGQRLTYNPFSPLVAGCKI